MPIWAAAPLEVGTSRSAQTCAITIHLIEAVLAGSAARTRDRFREPAARQGEVLVPNQGRVALREAGIGGLPGEVQGGELFDEFSVLGPTRWNGSLVEAVSVDQPVGPARKELKLVGGFVRRLG